MAESFKIAKVNFMLELVKHFFNIAITFHKIQIKSIEA